MRPMRAWIRRHLSWSNTPAAWAERAGWLALLAGAVVGSWLAADWPWERRILLLSLWLRVLSILLRAEIIRFLGPVFFFELLRGSRRRIHFSRMFYAFILLGAVAYVHFVVIESDRRGIDSLKRQAAMAETFFLTFFSLQMLLVAVLTPVRLDD